MAAGHPDTRDGPPSENELLRLQDIPETSQLRDALVQELLHGRGRHAGERIDRLKRLVRDGQKRDRLQMYRPASCWCLGLGGKDRIALQAIPPSRDHYITWRSFCEHCQAGMDQRAQADAYRERLAREIPAMERRRVIRSWPSAKYAQDTFSSYCEQVIAMVGHLPDLNEKVIERLQAWCSSPSGNLYIWGPPGVGKTSLMYICARTILEAGETDVVVATVPDITEHIKSTFGKDSDPDTPTTEQVEMLYRECRVLCTDDWTKEYGTPWALHRLWGIINHRYNLGLRTVATCELSPDDLARVHSTSLVDRIIETAIVIHIPGPVIRGR